MGTSTIASMAAPVGALADAADGSEGATAPAGTGLITADRVLAGDRDDFTVLAGATDRISGMGHRPNDRESLEGET